MKIRFPVPLILLAASLLLAGCATSPLPAQVTRDHPASPQAVPSPIPPLETGLLHPTHANP